MAASRQVIPGFHFTLGITFFYLSLILLLPLAAFLLYASGMGLTKFLEVVIDPRVFHAYEVSFGTSLAAALINGVFGLLLAWVLVRYDFPGKRVLDGLIDLPFALPTAVAGIALTTLYAENGWLGQFFYGLGIPSAFSVFGITIALIFVGIPFVARSVQPVLRDLDPGLEEAATMFGASPWLTFRRVVFPELVSPLLTGFALAFARGIGEYGSVVFIAGNLPYETEIAPLLIMAKLEQFDYQAAAAIAIVMMAMSFAILLALNGYQRYRSKKQGV
ncbi:MAG: sulfate ABC transporter permease subunit CysT [Selenomonas sp.]|nr:sulfate ABC transporter permease subunit CysT [Selenomonas sp.]HBT79549.1 sulfate ABC transporter permease subunit CysT [Selenomonas sp.]